VIEEQKQLDPYHIWLGIPPKEQPPTHYRLLGLERFEDNQDAIDAAANRQSAYLQTLATGPNRKLCQQLLNEVAAARVCLLDTQKRQKYNEELRLKEQQAAAPAVSIVVDNEPLSARVRVGQNQKRSADENLKESTNLNSKLYLAALGVTACVLLIYLVSSLTSNSNDSETSRESPNSNVERQQPFELGAPAAN